MIRIVVSGVNMVEGGILSILNECLSSLKALAPADTKVLVLVHRRELISELPNNFDVKEYPEIKTSWRKRLNFEWHRSKEISAEFRPDLWIALHDMTPNVVCPVQVVYCHNPSPFYKLDLGRFFYDVKFSLFCLFYKYLYGLHIQRNRFVIVQQQWIREYFKKNYHVDTIVAYPRHNGKERPMSRLRNDGVFRFFYPAFPRIFKNMETLCAAAANLSVSHPGFELWLTFDGSENQYARSVKDQFRHIPQIRFLGLQTRQRVEELYAETDCLVFPSKLETWGLPLSEFIRYGRPILAADLPYAHETAGHSEKIRFFDADDAGELAGFMADVMQGHVVFDRQPTPRPQAPFFEGWEALLDFLISEAAAVKEGRK